MGMDLEGEVEGWHKDLGMKDKPGGLPSTTRVKEYKTHPPSPPPASFLPHILWIRYQGQNKNTREI